MEHSTALGGGFSGAVSGLATPGGGSIAKELLGEEVKSLTAKASTAGINFLAGSSGNVVTQLVTDPTGQIDLGDAATAGVMGTAGSAFTDKLPWTKSTGTSTINQMSYFGTRTVQGLTNFTAKNTSALWGSGITGASVGLITDSIPIP